MTTNNPNPLYPKGSTYTLEEFIPVIRAAQKMTGLAVSRSDWFKNSYGASVHSLLDLNAEPYTLLQDIQAPYDAPKPLTVEEIKLVDKVWFIDPDTGHVGGVRCWFEKADLITYGVPAYATKDDCQRAHDFYEKVEVE